MRVIAVARDFADGRLEAWSGVAASHWLAYVRDMLGLGRQGRGANEVAAVRVLLENGQLVTYRRRRA